MEASISEPCALRRDSSKCQQQMGRRFIRLQFVRNNSADWILGSCTRPLHARTRPRAAHDPAQQQASSRLQLRAGQCTTRSERTRSTGAPLCNRLSTRAPRVCAWESSSIFCALHFHHRQSGSIFPRRREYAIGTISTNMKQNQTGAVTSQNSTLRWTTQSASRNFGSAPFRALICFSLSSPECRQKCFHSIMD